MFVDMRRPLLAAIALAVLAAGIAVAAYGDRSAQIAATNAKRPKPTRPFPEERTWLKISWQQHADAPARQLHLYCGEPIIGTVPNPRRTCEALRHDRRLVQFLMFDCSDLTRASCPRAPRGPQEATVYGAIDGTFIVHHVYRISRCGAADWQRLVRAGLLPLS